MRLDVTFAPPRARVRAHALSLGLVLALAPACQGDSGGTDATTGPTTSTGVSTTMIGSSTSGPTTGPATTTTGIETTTGATTSEPTTSAPVTSSTGTTEATTDATSDATSGTTGTTTDEETVGSTGDLDCEAPGILLVCDKGPNTDPFQAIGVGCPGAPENTIPIAEKVFESKTSFAWRAATSFGTGEDPNAPGELLFRPREGERFLIVSTGRLPMLAPDGSLVDPNPQYDNDNNFNEDELQALPPPMSHLPGSNGGLGGMPFTDCDGVHDCSDSIEPNWLLGNGNPDDLLYGSFQVEVPAGVDGFLFDAVFFSSEYPEFVGDQFNDMFIGWSTSEAYTGNVTFFEGQPFTVTALAEAMESAGYVGDAPELAGTGFEGHGSTGWVTIQAQVVPGETFTFAFAIMDMGDSSKATATIVDNWRWDCKGCVPIEVDPSCGKPNHPKCCGLCVDPLADPLCDTEGHPKCCIAG